MGTLALAQQEGLHLHEVAVIDAMAAEAVDVDHLVDEDVDLQLLPVLVGGEVEGLDDHVGPLVE